MTTQACTLISWGCVHIMRWCGALEDYTLCWLCFVMVLDGCSSCIISSMSSQAFGNRMFTWTFTKWYYSETKQRTTKQCPNLLQKFTLISVDVDPINNILAYDCVVNLFLKPGEGPVKIVNNQIPTEWHWRLKYKWVSCIIHGHGVIKTITEFIYIYKVYLNLSLRNKFIYWW